MKPLFPFYGSKWRAAKLYPPPHHKTVVEPFAGAAGYSTYYEPEHVLLVDCDPIIIGVWQYLIHATQREILALPDLDVGQNVRDFRLPQEAQWLIGFWLNRASAQPKLTKTAYSARTERSQLIWGPRARQRIAESLASIRHWNAVLDHYQNIPTHRATWFIDPPYTCKGKYYRCHDIGYEELAQWCLKLRGQIIVCEQEGASWLPFEALATVKSTKGTSSEVFWYAENAGTNTRQR